MLKHRPPQVHISKHQCCRTVWKYLSEPIQTNARRVGQRRVDVSWDWGSCQLFPNHFSTRLHSYLGLKALQDNATTCTRRQRSKRASFPILRRQAKDALNNAQQPQERIRCWLSCMYDVICSRRQLENRMEAYG